MHKVNSSHLLQVRVDDNIVSADVFLLFETIIFLTSTLPQNN